MLRVRLLIAFLIGLLFGETFAQNLEVEIDISDTISCNCVGYANLNIINGSGSYSFIWSDGAENQNVTNMCSGVYSVTVSDLVLIEDTIIDFSIVDTCVKIGFVQNDSVTSWNCNGYITAIPEGGQPPYSFLWSSGETTQNIDDLCPGEYCVSVYDFDGHISVACGEVENFIDTSCSADFFWMPAGSASCYETCFQFFNQSAGNDYNLTWSFGDSVFATSETPIFSFTNYGTPTVCLTIETSTCIDSTCMIIPVDSCNIQLDTIVGHVSVFGDCNGFVDLSYQNATQPVDLQWSNGSQDQNLTNLCAGTYCVTLTDAFACKDSVCVEVVQPQDTNCQAAFEINRVALKDFEFVDVSPSSNIVSWDWNFGDNSSSAVQNPVHTYSNLGDYQACLIIETETGCVDTACENIHIDTCLLSLNTNYQHVSCHGMCDGTVMLIPVNGEAPYVYEWQSPGSYSNQNLHSQLCAGTYQATVTDSYFCTATSVVYIDQPDSLVVTSVETPASCQGICNGTIDLNVSGGTPPYAYYVFELDDYVQNPIENLCPGHYSLMVSDNNLCAVMGAVSIEMPPVEMIFDNIDVDDISCWLGCDGAVHISVAGGSTPYAYLWSNGETTTGIDSLCFNQYNYNVTVTDDNGCFIDTTIIVSQPPPINVSLSKQDLSCYEICNGTAQGTASGGTFPYSFEWSNGEEGTSISNLCSGQYVATVTDANLCTATENIVLNEPDSLYALFSDIQEPKCYQSCDGLINTLVQGGTTPYSYEWVTGETSMSRDSLCAGNYRVTVTDAMGCTDVLIVGLSSPENLDITMSSSQESEYGLCDGVALVDVSGGTAPYSYSWNTGDSSMSIDNLCSGMYFLTVTDINACTEEDSVYLPEPVSYNLSGRVFAGTNVLPEGVAILYRQTDVDDYVAQDWCNIFNGNYSFLHLGMGDYLVYAIPHFDVVLQTPIYLPTYFGNKCFWQNAELINLTDHNTDVDIFLKKYDPIFYGSGQITGRVLYDNPAYYEDDIYNTNWFGSKAGKSGNGAKNVPVLLLSDSNVPYTFTLAGEEGQFVFNSVPYQLYKIYPEKAGYTTYPVSVEVYEDEPLSDSTIYSITEDQIATSLIESRLVSQTNIQIYPNPVQERVYIDARNMHTDHLTVKLFNELGMLLDATSFNGEQILEFSMKQHAAGIYTLHVSDENSGRILQISKIIHY